MESEAKSYNQGEIKKELAEVGALTKNFAAELVATDLQHTTHYKYTLICSVATLNITKIRLFLVKPLCCPHTRPMLDYQVHTYAPAKSPSSILLKPNTPMPLTKGVDL
ncbi:MAG: hypothetical protein L3J28_09300 [Candidatus Polarisedimenticolaceae bacterium]|nr:hypothetical protein [Candidatus Polarisedimenticolaceae bacterium]